MNVPDRIRLTGLSIPCIIGLYDWERKRKQKVVLDLSFPCDAKKTAHSDKVEDAVDYKKIAKAAQAFVGKSSYQLIETLAEDLAAHLLGLGLEEITLQVSKPGAIRHAQNVSITLTRRKKLVRAHFSLGSNIEPKKHLSAALLAFQTKFGPIQVSSWYETSPVGTRARTPFWNIVAGIDTQDKPDTLRRWTRSLESQEGRLRFKDRFAPRTLDVDLIDWGGKIEDLPKSKSQNQSSKALPHPDISSKAFVLFPFLEIAPRWIHPLTQQSLVEIAANFQGKSQHIRRIEV
jgi:dihydroneopterin aldolase/2-amino-4-hydroxy-6-hydroxymethyldihydropteridine diphosphokinase